MRLVTLDHLVYRLAFFPHIPYKEFRVVAYASEQMRVLAMPVNVFYNIRMSSSSLQGLYLRTGLCKVPETYQAIIWTTKKNTSFVRIPAKTISFLFVTEKPMLRAANIVYREWWMLEVVENENCRRGGLSCNEILILVIKLDPCKGLICI